MNASSRPAFVYIYVERYKHTNKSGNRKGFLYFICFVTIK